MNTTDSSIMAALEQLEATEANLIKLERLWDELEAMVPEGVEFGSNFQYEDRTRAFTALVGSMPMIDGWKPEAELHSFDEIAQNRLDAMELGETHIVSSVEAAILEPGRELREYRFRLNNMRKAVIREALIGLIDQIDADIRKIRELAGPNPEHGTKLPGEAFIEIREHLEQIGVLLGSSVPKPVRWGDMRRHMGFGYVGDLDDIENVDWPQIKTALRADFYGMNEAVPVAVADLSSLVAARPIGQVTTALAWHQINAETFERLIFTLIGLATGYENPAWLMRTQAPDRGRDLSATRVIQDDLSGTTRKRVIIQCKHWLSRSIAPSDIAEAKEQMALWSNPRVDILIFATSGRFTADAVAIVEAHNASGTLPYIELWPESHLERILAARPAIIGEFSLRGH